MMDDPENERKQHTLVGLPTAFAVHRPELRDGQQIATDCAKLDRHLLFIYISLNCWRG